MSFALVEYFFSSETSDERLPWWTKFINNLSEMSTKSMLLKISQNSQETPMSESFFNKVAGCRPATLLKRESGAGVFM